MLPWNGGLIILVDSAVGSRELLTGIRQLGCDAECASGVATDFQWDGWGPSGQVLVGCERKSVSDLLDSVRSHRLAGGQVGRALDTYDYYYLIVEGPWRRAEGGMLEIGWPWHQPKGQFRYAEIVHFLNRLMFLGGVYVWQTFDVDHTTATLVNWHDQWQRPWSEHLDKRVIYAPAPIAPRQGRGIFQSEATPVQKWLYQLPGLGDKKTFELAEMFSAPRSIVEMQQSEWEGLPGIGKTGAKKIWSWIHNASA